MEATAEFQEQQHKSHQWRYNQGGCHIDERLAGWREAIEFLVQYHLPLMN